MSNKKYDDRFAQALAARLGDAFAVTNEQGLIVARHVGGGQLSGWSQMTDDRRRPVTRLAVSRWVDYAATWLRRSLPAFTPEARAEAMELLGDIKEVAA